MVTRVLLAIGEAENVTLVLLAIGEAENVTRVLLAIGEAENVTLVLLATGEAESNRADRTPCFSSHHSDGFPPVGEILLDDLHLYNSERTVDVAI